MEELPAPKLYVGIEVRRRPERSTVWACAAKLIPPRQEVHWGESAGGWTVAAFLGHEGQPGCRKKLREPANSQIPHGLQCIVTSTASNCRAAGARFRPVRFNGAGASSTGSPMAEAWRRSKPAESGEPSPCCGHRHHHGWGYSGLCRGQEAPLIRHST